MSAPSRPRRSLLPQLLPLLPLLLLFALPLALAGCGDAHSQADEAATPAPSIPVEIEVVEPRPLKDVMVLPGTAESYQDVLLASELDGAVQWIGAREGQRVKQGQLLAKIDVDARRAALQRAQAAFGLAKSQAQRRQKLAKRKVVPQEDLDKSLTQMALAKSDLDQARISHEQGFVKSPIDGVINRLYVDPGEFIKRGAPLAEVVNVARIRIKCNVPEMDVRYLKSGQDALAWIDAFPEEKWLGQISFVAFKADGATKTFEVWVDVDNSAGHIRPGMIGRAAFLRRQIPAAITAPLTALVDKGGERIVFLEKDGQVQARTVEIGVISVDRVQLTKGLKPGDRLIVKGQKLLEEGMTVACQ